MPFGSGTFPLRIPSASPAGTYTVAPVSSRIRSADPTWSTW